MSERGRIESYGENKSTRPMGRFPPFDDVFHLNPYSFEVDRSDLMIR
jgi:hypothetical protein